MKTNTTMRSADRDLSGIVIRQETKTGFLNVPDLTKAYKTERSRKGWSYRRTDEISDSTANAERIFYILQEQGCLAGSGYNPIKEEYPPFYEKQ